MGPALHWAWLGPLQASEGTGAAPPPLPCLHRGLPSLRRHAMWALKKSMQDGRTSAFQRESTGSRCQHSGGRATQEYRQRKQLFSGRFEESFSARRYLSCLPSQLGAETWNSTMMGSFLWLRIQTSSWREDPRAIAGIEDPGRHGRPSGPLPFDRMASQHSPCLCVSCLVLLPIVQR